MHGVRPTVEEAAVPPLTLTIGCGIALDSFPPLERTFPILNGTSRIGYHAVSPGSTASRERLASLEPGGDGSRHPVRATR